MAAIDHLLDDFDDIAREAVARYRRYDPDVLLELDSRAEASCVYCHMYASATRRFSDRTDVRAVDTRGLKVWIVGNDAVIRFKKMDEDGRSRTYPTKQAKAYDRGDELPGIPPPPARLTIGYLLDASGTRVDRVQVSRPIGKRIDWCAAIVPASDREIGQARWIDVTRQRKLA